MLAGLEPANAIDGGGARAIGLDGMTTRWLLISVLDATGTEPSALTPDDLGTALPEIERRLRQLVQPGQADDSMARLRRILIDLGEPDDP